MRRNAFLASGRINGEGRAFLKRVVRDCTDPNLHILSKVKLLEIVLEPILMETVKEMVLNLNVCQIKKEDN